MMLQCDYLLSWKKTLEILWTSIYIMFVLVVPSNLSFEFVNCEFKYQFQLFDFNRLALKPWIVSDIHVSTLSYISLSICNNTHQSPCGIVGFCVIMKDNSKWSSLKSNLYVLGDRGSEDIRLSTVLNKMDSGRSTELKLELKFICSAEIGIPKFEEFKSRQLVVQWKTVAACHLENLVPYKNCIFEDELMGEFNLQSLRQLLYYNTTNSKGSRFYVNVCGGTVGVSVCGNVTDIAVCMIDSGNKSSILGYASRELISRKDLRLEYRIKKKNVKIELMCNSRVQLGELELKYETNSSLIFYLETPLACINKLTKCFVQDKDHLTYNLSSLSAKDYEIYENKHKYVISVCRSVKNSYCLGGVSICLQTGNSTVNLGTLKEGPHYDDNDNQLSISSSDGAYCNVSNFRYRSVIIFKCAKTDSLPLLVNISETCVYTFVWQTKSACPFMFIEGENCRVQDQEYGYDFDLNPLRNSTNDYIINDNNGGHFRLNICGDLLKPCNGSKNVSVCLIDRRGTQHAIGEVAKLPHYNDGRLSFELNGELCKSNPMPSKVNIKFKCNQQETGHPEFVEKHEDCTYIFEWHTPIACAEFESHDCKVADDNGEVYDLSPLSLHNDDYIVWHNSTNGHWKFIINVCRSIMFGNSGRCPTAPAICMQNMSEPNYPKSFTSLGHASALQYDKTRNVLKVDYSGGKTCLDGRYKGDFNYKSTIRFVCDKESPSYPKLTGINGCEYEFTWGTKLACSKKMESKHEDNTCKTYNSYTGVRVDLSSFVGCEYQVKHKSGRLFRFVVCGSLNNASSTGVGICQETEDGCENVGMGNSNLYYNTGKLYLNYTDGANCAGNAKKYTIIEFICDTKDNGRQSIISLSPCAYSVSWFTSLACMVPCTTDGSKQINLSFLSNNENYYKTTSNGVDYFISVCKPLVPKEGLNCNIGSAICKAIPQGESKWTEGVSLGFPHLRPAFLGNNVILNYSSDQQCPNNSAQNVESSIIFICDTLHGIGVPVLNQLLQSNCHYEFIWKTSVVCDDNTIKLTDAVTERMINNSQSNMYIDLQPFCKIGKYEVGNFMISMCGQHHLCEIQNIQKNISYGRAAYVVFNYSENKTMLFMTNGDECEATSDDYHSSIHLLCTTNSVDDLHILKETDCGVEFVWKSSSACGHVGSAAAIGTIVVASKSSAGTIGVIVGLILAVIACLIVYCVKKSTHTNCCRRNINRFLSRRHEGEFHYTLRNPDSYDFDMSAEELL